MTDKGDLNMDYTDYPKKVPIPLQTEQKLNVSMSSKAADQSGSVVQHGVQDPNKITPIGEQKPLSPAEKRMLRLIQGVRRLIYQGIRKPVTSKHAQGFIEVEPNKIRAHKRKLREIQQASRKVNRGVKGYTKRKGQQ